jgi:hypothetical protein
LLDPSGGAASNESDHGMSSSDHGYEVDFSDDDDEEE